MVSVNNCSRDLPEVRASGFFFGMKQDVKNRLKYTSHVTQSVSLRPMNVTVCNHHQSKIKQPPNETVIFTIGYSCIYSYHSQ